jgi:uncharacterized OB-fold protein
MEKTPFNDISYGQFLNEEKLMGSRCKECDALFLPPRPICTQCHCTEMAWVEMEGRGTLSAFTCIGIGPSFMMEEGFNRKNPYCSGVVQLKEGVRVDARIEGVDTRAPEKIRVGMALNVKFLHREREGIEKTYLAFEPV